MRFQKILKPVLAVALVVCVGAGVGLTALRTNAKDLVMIEEQENCDLQYLSLDGRHNENVWEQKGNLTQSGGMYVLKSNGWGQWSTTDNLAMGYKEVAFNYSDKAQITVETTMTSFDGAQSNAGAGLMIRTGTNPGSACMMLHFRPNEIMITYRMKDGVDSVQGKTLSIPTKGLYPVTFKAVVIKGESKVHCYYKTTGEYVEFGTAPMIYGDKLYIGISDYSNLSEHMATANFSSFSYKVEAPEGYTIIGDGGSGETPEPEEPEDVLPEDYPVAEDVLLSETFTDGSMFDGEESVTNPIWKSNAQEANIVTNEEKTNRYLSQYMMDNIYYTAGDQGWTDYQLSSQFRYTKEYSEQEQNQLVYLVRYTDIDGYGYMYYYVSFRTVPAANAANNKYLLELGLVDSAKNLYSERKVMTSVPLNYLTEEFIDQWHTIDIQAFDNTITVFLDGTEMLSYADFSALCKTEGSIGFMTNMAAVDIDNITVTKMVDLLGGDYDNRIGGNWNEEIPDYLKEFEDKGLPY